MNKGVKYEPILTTIVSPLKEISMFANPGTGENEHFAFSYSVIKSYLFGCNSLFCQNPTIPLPTPSHSLTLFWSPSGPGEAWPSTEFVKRPVDSLTTKLRRDYNLFLYPLVDSFLRCHWLSFQQRALLFIFHVWKTVTFSLAAFLFPMLKCSSSQTIGFLLLLPWDSIS